ncbi:NAD(P)-dependent oxidoreductase [Pontibacter sp. G13]|uniref:NAD(P)-dependent oxidoreductase n=1 Tax=Pontibacter sp. G13 TaxID=3074898 RepID=UPI00288A5079|nr:NAD(P)-dependent oxidoreductase [Pontibacter sp. G13]WNJ16023.1 NAD(P)-dependent oxidoreductase [Pontibacter sp. G13]
MNVLIIDRFPKPFLDALAQLPVQITYVPEAKRPEILPLLAETNILVMNSKIRLDPEAADLAPHLKMVIRAGVGMDHISVDYLEGKGVKVRNTQGGNADAVGEQAVGMMLALNNNLMIANQQVKSFEWIREANRGREIGRQTVGIIGYGHTGKSVARKLSGFGTRVLAHDKFLTDFSDKFAKEAQLEELFAEADILTMHVPLTDDTREWIDAEFLSQFRKPIVFLNLARGPVVKLSGLLHALDQGQVTAAAIDVLENEKLHTLTERQKSEYENLFSRENVILTPHIGGWTFESLSNINNMILAHIQDEIAAS